MTHITFLNSLAAMAAYSPPRHPAPCDLDLSGTELPPLSCDCLGTAPESLDQLLGHYPDTTELKLAFAKQLNIDPDRLVVTAGSDDALGRVIRLALQPGSEAILTAPTFEMLPRFVQQTGASFREIGWPGTKFPLDDILAAVTPNTRVIAIVSPNNPTGAVATSDELATLARECPEAIVVVDQAYVEFADTDPLPALLEFPNVVLTRTFSKAWGLPGIRVGAAVAVPDVAALLGRVSPPYPVSAQSLKMAIATLDSGTDDRDRRARLLRARQEEIATAMDHTGFQVVRSESHFVSTASSNAEWLRDGLAGLGIAVRWLSGPDTNRVRIRAPLSVSSTNRLLVAIECVANPEALLLDMDGVLADVSDSYDQAIISTAASYDLRISASQIADFRAGGCANDDWTLTRDLLTQNGVSAPLEEVTRRFEEQYQGSGARDGYKILESLIPSANLVSKLADRLRLGIVTGRPRRDAERFLEENKIRNFFEVVVCREDAPLKPDPKPVQLAVAKLGVSRAWMVGDTPDDINAARGAGVVPLGITPPRATSTKIPESLTAAGAARVLTSLEDIFICLD